MFQVFKRLKVLPKVTIHLVELSPTLSLIQANALCVTSQEHEGNCYRKGITEEGVEVCWYYAVEDVPKNFSIIVAQEFFDAVPIRKFQVSILLIFSRSLHFTPPNFTKVFC